MVVRLTCNEDVEGSSPSAGSDGSNKRRVAEYVHKNTLPSIPERCVVFGERSDRTAKVKVVY